MAYTNIATKKRIVVIFSAILIGFLILIGRLMYIQVFKYGYYSQGARELQTKDRFVSAKRGTIYDSTGEKILAQSSSSSIISVIPTDVKSPDTVADKLSEILGLDRAVVYEKATKKTGMEVIAKKVDKSKSTTILEWVAANNIKGIKVDEDVSRVYPYNNVLSQTLGFCGTDNQGLFGIEKYYDDVLKGVPGRIVYTKDAAGRETPFDQEQYVNSDDGMDLVLTIDVIIQQILEKNIKKCGIENSSDQVAAIVMDTQTGAVLGMASYPDFDLNSPYTPNTEELKNAWSSMEQSAKTEALMDMWRNKVISNTYEPGSTYKVITASIALEENVVKMESAEFNCTGSMMVPGWNKPIKCWRYYNPHGIQTIRQALMNSCNPALMQIGLKIGIPTFNKYIDAYGLNRITGIDLPGEASSILHDPNAMTNVDLATMSFGQGIQFTPLQLITAVSGVANNGQVMKPYLVKEIKSKDNTYSKKIEPTMIKKVVSEQTSKDILSIMESVATDGTAKGAQVRGYRVGAKTGTGEQGRGDNKWYVASCLAVAPVSNPKISVILAVYNPKGPLGYQGGVIAAPVVGQIMDEVLRYLDIPPDVQTGQNDIKEIVIPEVRTKTVEEAKKVLQNAGFKVNIDDNVAGTELVKDQMPKPGASLKENSIIKLYTEGKDARVSVKVPDVRGKSMITATSELNKLGLNIRLIGLGTAASQDPVAGTDVEPGTIITIRFIDSTSVEE